MGKTKGATAQPRRTLAERNGPLLTLQEVADALAVNERMVRRLVYRYELPVTHVGKLIRVHQEDLDNYIAQQREGS